MWTSPVSVGNGLVAALKSDTEISSGAGVETESETKLTPTEPRGFCSEATFLMVNGCCTSVTIENASILSISIWAIKNRTLKRLLTGIDTETGIGQSTKG